MRMVSYPAAYSRAAAYSCSKSSFLVSFGGEPRVLDTCAAALCAPAPRAPALFHQWVNRAANTGAA
eukprot:SAG11_NODE_21746_length_419_cov_1.281250_1_plen_65_part_01